MQVYINPFDLLKLNLDIKSGYSSETILKAKKSLLAEIELNDANTVYHNGREFNKSDCLRAIDELDYKNKMDFHLFIYQNKNLNNFLSKGDLSFFSNYKVESIYTLTEFVDFISPFFTLQYEKALCQNFKNNETRQVKNLLAIKPLVNQNFLDGCYKSTYSKIKEIENEIIQIINNIENKKSHYIENNFQDLPEVITKKVNFQLINLLPFYFQSLRNQLAQTIRNLARDINNDPFEKYKPAFEIIQIANNLDTDGLVKQTITKGYYTIKKNYEDSFSKSINPLLAQTFVQKTSLTEKEDNDEGEDDKIEKNKIVNKKSESKDLFYEIFICLSLALGFFYIPAQKIILGLSSLIVLFPFFAYKRVNDFSLKLFFKNNVLFIAAVGFGFFYTIIAQLFISYYFFYNLTELYKELSSQNKKEKRSLGIYHFLTGALLVTFLYYNYFSYPISLNTKETNIEQVQTDKDFYEKGLSLFMQSKYSDAIVQFDKAININAKNIEAIVLRGSSNCCINNFEKAIPDFEEAQLLGNKSSGMYAYWGLACSKLKHSEKAFEYLGKAIELDSSNFDAYRWRGDLKYNTNDNLGAIADYTKAIYTNPTASNYFVRGLAFFYLKDYHKAIDDFDMAIQINPNIGQYYYERGDAKNFDLDLTGACKDWIIAKEKGYDVPDSKIKRCIPQIIYVLNGELTGCNKIEPKYNREFDNKLLITVGNNTSVAVKLINIASEKCIRYVFINRNSTYSIRNIPEGKYYLKIAYGNDWSIMKGESVCDGRFTRNAIFEKGKEILNYNPIISGNETQIPSFSLKLDVVISDNKMNDFKTDKINETDFYNE